MQNAYPQDDLWEAVTILFEDDLGVIIHVAKHDEYYSEILLWQQLIC